MEQRVLVCGGRGYDNRALLYSVLQVAHMANPIVLLIHGGAPGADTLAADWARGEGVPTKVFKADWKKHGRAAGPLRNKHMLVEGDPHLVIAFPGGRGTESMVNLAMDASVPVARVKR